MPAVAFESPQRLPALLAELAGAWPDRPVAVCRELTKLHEEVVRGPAAEVAERFTAPPRGEIAVVIGPAPAAGAAAEPAALRAALTLMLDGGLGAGGAAEVAAALGAASRNDAYRVALELAARRRAET